MDGDSKPTESGNMEKMSQAEFEREYLGIDSESIKNILIPIEQKISDISREIGPGVDADEMVDADLELMVEVVKQSYLNRPPFMNRGDHNIQLMASISMISTAWLLFILKAKSLNSARYDEDQRELFDRSYKLHRAYHAVLMNRAAELGEVYDREGRWGIPDCTTDPIRTPPPDKSEYRGFDDGPE